MKILIVIDNFRIGGMERLALDQIFMLSDLKLNPMALFRQELPTKILPNFLSAEKSRIAEKDIQILALPNSDLRQLKFMWRLFKENSFSLIINHSIGASVLLRLAQFLSGKNIPIKSFIHQLPSLSGSAQRRKRFAYSLFSHEVYGYSKAVIQDWNSRTTKKFGFYSLRFGKKIELLRNGIYLERLPNIQMRSASNQNTKRLVFIGRNVTWKNLPYLESILEHPLAKEFKALIVLPEIDEGTLKRLESSFPDRIKFEIGKKIEDITFESFDVNIYPVNYGPFANFIESISLNCLEMACLGIPSLVTAGGVETWPELKDKGIFVETDWSNLESVISIIKQIQVLSEEDKHFCLKTISINRNIEKILGLPEYSLLG